jgi:probable HAF family extracellular repeat protein
VTRRIALEAAWLDRRRFRAITAVLVLLNVACEEPMAPVATSPAFTLLTEITVSDLGTAGGLYANGHDINDDLWIATGANTTSLGTLRAMLWTEAGGFTGLGSLGGDLQVALGINNAGEVVGHAAIPTGEVHAFRWTAADGMVDLGTLGAPQSTASAINDRGDIAGDMVFFPQLHRAFFWTAASGMTPIGTLGGDRSQAFDINDLGQVVGQSRTADLYSHAFLWTAASGMRDLGDLGGGNSRATGINNLGTVVGGSMTPAGVSHAFVWTEADGMVDIGTLGGSQSFALGINDLGQVVGWSYIDSPGALVHAFLWTESEGMIDLGVAPGMTISRANAINNRGEVAGHSEGGGETHLTLWTTLRPATPAEEVEVIRDALQDLIDSGALTSPTGPLYGPLDAAERLILLGNEQAAVTLIGNFLARVDDLVASGELTESEAQPLRDAAEGAIQELSA